MRWHGGARTVVGAVQHLIQAVLLAAGLAVALLHRLEGHVARVEGVRARRVGCSSREESGYGPTAVSMMQAPRDRQNPESISTGDSTASSWVSPDKRASQRLRSLLAPLLPGADEPPLPPQAHCLAPRSTPLTPVVCILPDVGAGSLHARRSARTRGCHPAPACMQPPLQSLGLGTRGQPLAEAQLHGCGCCCSARPGVECLQLGTVYAAFAPRPGAKFALQLRSGQIEPSYPSLLL